MNAFIDATEIGAFLVVIGFVVILCHSAYRNGGWL